jgi:hypothetical protein
MNSQINRQAPDAGAARLLVDWLGRQKVASVQTSGPLSVIPVYGGQAMHAIEYRTLGDAIALGEVLINEQAQASVGDLRVLNNGPLPVLILDGEEVVGGLQNRVVNTTLLIPPETTFELPVSCIEHGRWHLTAGAFQPGETVHPTLRRQKAQQVTASLYSAEAPLADQHAIWAEVEARHRSTRTHSATAALRDAYVQRGQDLDSIVSRLEYPSDNPTGVVALYDGHAACADLFDRPETLRRYWNRLVRSYALEALDLPPREPSPGSAARLLQRATCAALQPFASVGAGTDVRITGNGVVGAALVHGGAMVHAGLFRHRERGVGGLLQSPRARARRIATREQS